MTIIGHKRQRDLLSAMATSAEIPHAMLFEGPSQLGKKTLALEFVGKLLCEKGVGCGLCRSCIALGKASHPDVALISSRGKEIQIDQIRELVRGFSLKPYSAPFKVAIIDDAHLMNRESQNSILKLLEEPGGNSIMILVTDYPESLLSTVRSRTRRMAFFPVSDSDINSYLRERGCDESLSKEITLFSFGKPGLAMEFLSESIKIGARRGKIKEFLGVISPGAPFRDRFEYVKDLAEDSEKTEESLKMWLSYFRALMIKKVEGNKGIVYSLPRIKYSLEAIGESIDLVSRTNTNKKMVLEKLIMEL